MKQINAKEFVCLSDTEMQEVDGGAGLWATIAKGVLAAGKVVGTACGVGATGGVVIIGACVVVAGVAIYGALNS